MFRRFIDTATRRHATTISKMPLGEDAVDDYVRANNSNTTALERKSFPGFNAGISTFSNNSINPKGDTNLRMVLPPQSTARFQDPKGVFGTGGNNDTTSVTVTGPAYLDIVYKKQKPDP
ncbi:MAG: hypothetical protein AAF195_03270 [Pseudomonadota bacterium]